MLVILQNIRSSEKIHILFFSQKIKFLFTENNVDENIPQHQINIVNVHDVVLMDNYVHGVVIYINLMKTLKKIQQVPMKLLILMKMMN
jgi:hypothetical protein